MKIALVYDRVTKIGGAERVLTALHELYPEAPLYTSVYHPQGAPWAAGFQVKTSFLQRLPLVKTHHEWFAPLMVNAFESFNFSAYDVVISVTSAEAKGIITSPHTTHLCYLLTPTRYLWHSTHLHTGKGLTKVFRSPFLTNLRQWDYLAAQRPDKLIAISKTVSDRCRKFYRRQVDSIIYPPIDYQKFSLHPQECFYRQRDYYLVISRLVPYKNIDLVVRAFTQIKDQNLIVVGVGSEANYLKSIASDNISFMSHVTDGQLSCLYHHAKGLIFPQEEDFGIVALEAQSAGIPVLAYNRGGATETVIPGVTGILYDENQVMALTHAIKQSQAIAWDRSRIQSHAQKFDKLSFMKSFAKFVKEAKEL